MNQLSKKKLVIENKVEDLSGQDSVRSIDREFIKNVTQNYQRLFAYIVTFAPNRQDAEDLMQETVVQMWGKFSQFDPSLSFYRWGIGFARNNLRQYHRNRKPTYLALDGELLEQLTTTRFAVEELLELRRDAMALCIASLPVAQKQLLESCYVDHESIPKAAKTLGRSATALYKALHRIRAKLTNCIDRKLRHLNQIEGEIDGST